MPQHSVSKRKRRPKSGKRQDTARIARFSAFCADNPFNETIAESVARKIARERQKLQYFWFSAGQKKTLDEPSEEITEYFESDFDGGHRIRHSYRSSFSSQNDMFVRIKGVEHIYTEVTSGPKPSGAWKDYVLLGVATMADTFSRKK
jgi:hypothetical protein